MNGHINTAVRIVRKVATIMTRASNHLDNTKYNKEIYRKVLRDTKELSEQIILKSLQTIYPEYSIHVENRQYFDKSKLNPEYEWVVSLLDGTDNFLSLNSNYAISISLLQRGIPVEAVIFAPEKNILFTASRGNGAFVNGKQRITVSKKYKLDECLIGTSLAKNQLVMPSHLSILKEVLCQTAGVRDSGSTVLDLCNVATGRLDGYFEFNLKPWDLVAGALMITEAKGFVSNIQEGDDDLWESGNIVAGNPKILPKLLKIMNHDVHSFLSEGDFCV